MAGDPFKKVQPGQRLEVTAEAYNAFLDAARAVREQKQFGTEASQFFRQSGIAKIKNVSGADQKRFAVLGLTEPIILPENNESEFKRQITFEGTIPVGNVHKSKFAILLEPIAAGKIGLAVVAGVVPVRLQVAPQQLYDYAEVIGGSTEALRNRPHGSARVLWVEEGISSERWAIVRLGDGEDVLRFRLLEALPRCGSASANLVVFQDGEWCPTEVTFTTHDSIGLAGPAAAGTCGIAKWFEDSRKWEVVVLGEGCCSSSGDTSGGSGSSGDSSGGGSTSSGDGSGNGGSSSSGGNGSDSSGESGSTSSGVGSGSGSSGGSSSGETIPCNECLSKLCVARDPYTGAITGIYYMTDSGLVAVPECDGGSSGSGSNSGSGSESGSEGGSFASCNEPQVLTLTFASITGPCSCLSGATFTISKQNATTWSGNTTICGNNNNVTLTNTGNNNWSLTFQFSFGLCSGTKGYSAGNFEMCSPVNRTVAVNQCVFCAAAGPFDMINLTISG